VGNWCNGNRRLRRLFLYSSPLSRFSCYLRTPMPARGEVLPQSHPEDSQRSFRRFLKFGRSRHSHLLRILGVGFGLAVGIGNTIGTGILRTPGEVAGYLRNGWLIFAVWLLGGTYALLCSSSVTELGCMLPCAGGWYVYSRRAFGEKAGFVVGCCDFTVQSVADAYLAVAFGEFVGELLPKLAGHVMLLGTLALASLATLNWIGLKTGSRAQEITSLVKALGLVALVIAAFTIPIKAGAASFLPGNLFVHPHSIFLGLMLALQGVVVTYDGWYAPIYFVEEDKNPAKNLPRSMIGTALSCIAIFLLVNAALYHVLHMDHLAGSRMPSVDAAMLLFGSYGRRIILLIAVVGVISSANAGLMFTPRILFSMSRDGLLPRNITSVNRGGTPSLALFLSTMVSIALVLRGSFDALIAIGSILYVAVYLSGFASLLILRRTEPDLARPYKAWWYPWSTLLVLSASTAFLVGSVIGDLKHSLFTAILISLTYAASIVIVREKSHEQPDA
jgi:APA family basic amino acid/polyamine antiporter